MKTITGISAALMLAACATSQPEGGVRRDRIPDCPVGTILICESATLEEPSRGGDEEIPEYDRCYCELDRVN